MHLTTLRMKIEVFTVNPFQQNTSVLIDETGQCAIVDPGFMEKHEEVDLVDFIESNELQPVLLLNTHCHIDHILGNKFVADKYSLDLWIHKDDLPLLTAAKSYAHLYGLNYNHSPEPRHFMKEGEIIKFGNTELKVLHVPGHAPGHVVFVDEAGLQIIGGDVLFRGSIGRTDLPGGNHDLLLKSIREKIFTLNPDYTIYPGHGPTTTVGYEVKNNPFF
jgi:hydroxyacylglutathione hydrolase